MPSEDYLVRWYLEDRPTLPDDTVFEYSPDAIHWTPIEVVAQQAYPNCIEGIVTSEVGYLRAKGIITNSGATSGWSGVMALPEPSVGLSVALLLLLGLAHRRQRAWAHRAS